MFWSKAGMRVAMAVGVVGVVCASMGRAGARQQDVASVPRAAPSVTSPPGSFRADIVVRHERRSVDGAIVGRPVERAMRIERRTRQGRSHTTLHMVAPRRALIDTPGRRTTITNPAHIARVEFDDDGRAPRLYDAAGRVVAPLSDEVLRLLRVKPSRRTTRPGAPGLEQGEVFGTFLADTSRRQERRQELRRRFGAPAGRVRGLDRFTQTADGIVTEVLAMPDEGLPVEMSASSAEGRTRTSFLYQPAGVRGHVRRLTRTEMTIGPSSERSVTEVRLSNVVVDEEVLP